MEHMNGTSGAPANETSGGAPTSGTSGAPANEASGARTSGTSETPTEAAAKKGILDNVDKKQVMEKAFALLKSQGKNTVEGIFKYLKERNILDDSTEKIAKQAMDGVSDPKNIGYGKFAEVFGSLAKEKGFDLEHLTASVVRTLFGGGAATGSASTSSSPAAVGEARTSAQPATVEHYDEADDHHEPSEEHHESDEDHYISDKEHHESDDNHHESDDNHHESDDNHHEPSDHHDSSDHLHSTIHRD